MRHISRQTSFLNRVLPASLLFAALIGLPLTGSAQQSMLDDTSAPTAVSSPQPSVAEQDPPITAEDVGDSLLIHRRYHEALDQYKKMPDPSPDLWNKMGITYQMLFDLKDATRCYKQTLRLLPGHAWALNNLATIYDAQGDFAKAEGLYRKALENDSDSARIAMNLGTNLMVQNKYSEGSAMYKRALALDPEVFDQSEGPVTENGVPVEQRGAMNYYKARGCAQAGLIDRAMKYLKKALSEGFTNPAQIARDSSFVRLRGNPEFNRLLSQQEIQPAR